MASCGGALLAVVPGVLGLMAFSSEPDACGNPWRAVHFCQVWPLAYTQRGHKGAPALIAVTCWVFAFFGQELISRFQLHSFDIRTPFRQILAYRQWKAESEVSLLILEHLHHTPG